MNRNPIVTENAPGVRPEPRKYTRIPFRGRLPQPSLKYRSTIGKWLSRGESVGEETSAHSRTTAARKLKTGHWCSPMAGIPYFDGWPDTLQLNYGNPKLQEAMIGELERIAGQCEGVRCDTAMLILPDAFERTWGIQAQPFWPKAAEQVRKKAVPFVGLRDHRWRLKELLGDARYDRDGNDLESRGLYLDITPWEYHVFKLQKSI
jgi:hypothetical protein